MSYSNPIKPHVYAVTVENGDEEEIEFGGVAVFVQINHTDGGPVSVYLDDVETPFTLNEDDVQTFNQGDMHLSKLTFVNSTSGAEDAVLEIIAGVVNL